jgi:hypothetical protein
MLDYFLPLYVSTTFQVINSLLRAPPQDLGRSIEVDVVRTRQGALKTRASIATFLAAVQAQTLAFSYQSNSTRLQVVINTFAFTGVLLDVIGAFLALQASTLVETYIDYIERLNHIVSQHDFADLQEVINSMQRPLSSSILALDPMQVVFVTEVRANLVKEIRIRSKKGDEIEAGLRTSDLRNGEASHSADPQSFLHDTLEAGRLVYTFNIASDAASVATRLGIVCFLVSVVCFARDTQPPAVWISAITVSSCATILPVFKTVFRTLFRSYFT